ncbi:RNA polymerase subunit sigma-70 [Frankia sp. CcI156]|uniref:hypothetical protein n=1 Tax=Frankia TaxID=1854 RepID=UPI0003D00682|nr:MULTISPECIES: hypothetical protein [Frankia]ETA00143.1 hypothetical protein CcI6DRAFT_04428 [Frankia sp. CcI6]KDA41205.1 hypothetical protein BMG523Draft_03986 [Frankia sp. BMG5.23]KEZ34723.1 hypothetical protein CEDDRAFT_03934 [Frankia sp. CeD]KFB02952.1 hypothetical protein ALLO2DRAFT_04277 [Frankia sp. Allo2]OAA19570.1 hypothetical protein AAY23_11056 [Frankia casuarinae]
MGENDLWTTGDIGRRLGITAERARQLSHRPDFPAPHIDQGTVRLWQPADVETWITQYRPAAAKNQPQP